MYINRNEYHPRVHDYISALPSSNRPANAYFKGINTFVKYLINSGLWNAWGCIGILCANNQNNCLVDLRNPANKFTVNGSPGPLLPYQSWQGDGATFYLDTHYAPSTNLGLLDHAFGMHVQNDLVHLGGHGVFAGTGQISLSVRRSPASGAIYSVSGTTLVPKSTGYGFHGLSRTQSDVARYYTNEAAANITCAVGTIMPTGNILIFRQGKSSGWSSDALSMFWIGHSQGVTDAMISGAYHVWREVLIGFQTLIFPLIPPPLTPPNAFQAGTRPYVSPVGQLIIRQFPGVPPDDVSDSTTIYSMDPCDVGVARPWSILNSTETRIQLGEIVWGDRNNFAPPPLNKPNDTNGSIKYVVHGVMSTAVVTTQGSGYGSNPTFQQIVAGGFTCTLGVSSGVITTATINMVGHDYPAVGSLTISDSAGTGGIINYTADHITGAVLTLTIEDGGSGNIAPTGAINVDTGTLYTISAVVVSGAITSVRINNPGRTFPTTGFFTFADGTGSGCRGSFSAADTTYTCQPEFTDYKPAMVSTNVKLAVSGGYKYWKDNRDPSQWGWRNFLIDGNIHDPTSWDNLYDQQCFDKAQLLTVSRFSNVIDSGIEGGLGYQMLVDMDIVDTFDGPAGTTLSFQLQSATDAAFTTPVMHGSSPTYNVSQLVAGEQFRDWKWGNYIGSGFSATLGIDGSGVIISATIDGGGAGTGYAASRSGLLRIHDTVGSGAVIRWKTNTLGNVTSLAIWKGGIGYVAPTCTIDSVCHRYLRLAYTVTGGPFTAGSLTMNAPMGAFRLQGSQYMGTFSPWGYYSLNASSTLFPNKAKNGLSRTCYDRIIPGQMRIADIDQYPCWGFCMDCEMDDDRGAMLFTQTIESWARIAHAMGYKIYLGMDPIVAGAGKRVGMDQTNGNYLANLVDFVGVVVSNVPANNDETKYINDQLNIYSGDPLGSLPIPYSHIYVQLNIGVPAINSSYVTTAKGIRDANGMSSLISPAYAPMGGPSTTDTNQAIINFLNIDPAGIFA